MRRHPRPTRFPYTTLFRSERAAEAWKEGRFDRSVVPVTDRNGLVVLDRDEHMRPGTTAESLASLKPSFADIGELGGFDARSEEHTSELQSRRDLVCRLLLE